jgi:hypothetical protein
MGAFSTALASIAGSSDGTFGYELVTGTYHGGGPDGGSGYVQTWQLTAYPNTNVTKVDITVANCPGIPAGTNIADLAAKFAAVSPVNSSVDCADGVNTKIAYDPCPGCPKNQ